MKKDFKVIHQRDKTWSPLMYNYIKQYRRFVVKDNPERVGVDLDEFGASHFFPYGFNKPISRVVDYEKIKEFKYESK